MSIRKLSPLLVNQIAAGEVIERPASVVKELVENSLDAGALRVDIVIEDGGKALIRVSDDGRGIAGDQLPLAVAPHATSKLFEPDELASIGTLGFRGEAIASIASVSRLRITSRATDDDGQTAEAGARIDVSGDQVDPVTPQACAPGSVVEVRDLFFNTPVRRKFMRAASTEFGHISDVVTRIAMAHPQVRFSLTHNGRKTIDLPSHAGDDGQRQRCVALLGRDLDEALLTFEHTEPELFDKTTGSVSGLSGGNQLWGLAGLPSIARATTKFQYLYLNGRPIRDRRIQHAIKEAYRGLIPPDRQPVVVVMLEIDPMAVDVNVHPAKTEVRLRDPNRIHGLVLSCLRQRLLGSDLTPQVTLPPVSPSGGSVSFDSMTSTSSGSSGSLGLGDSAVTSSGMGGGSVSMPPPPSLPLPAANESSGDARVSSMSATQQFVNYFRQMDPKQKGFVYQQVREALVDDDPQALLETSADGTSAGLPEKVAAPVRILQVHKSYVVTEDDQGIVIVDQHALHERVMFEQLRQRITVSKLESQRLLTPVVLNVSAGQIALLDTLGPLLEKIGIEATQLGPETIGIQAFASFLFDRNVDPAEFLTELLDRAGEGQLDVGLAEDNQTEEAVVARSTGYDGMQSGDQSRRPDESPGTGCLARAT